MPLTTEERNTIKQSVIDAIGSPAGEWWGVPIRGGFSIGATKKPLEWFLSLPTIHQRAVVYVLFTHMRGMLSFNGRTRLCWYIPFQAVLNHGWCGRRCPVLSVSATRAIWGDNTMGRVINDDQYHTWVEEYFMNGNNPDVACQVIDNVFSWVRAKQWFYGSTDSVNSIHDWVELYNYNKTETFTGNTANQLHNFLLSLLPDIYCDAINKLEPSVPTRERIIQTNPNAVVLSRGDVSENSTNIVMIHITTDNDLSALMTLIQNKITLRGKTTVFDALYAPSNKTKTNMRVNGVLYPPTVRYDIQRKTWIIEEEAQLTVYKYDLRNWLTYSQAITILNTL